MPTSTLKRWLSYLFELHVESAPSELNPHLYVSLKNGRYQLCTANAVYSYGDLYDNFTKVFSKLDKLKMVEKDVLVLGFGLGSVPIILEKMFPDSRFRFTGVEADEAVIYLANKYGIPDIRSPLEIVEADAFAFVFQTKQTFDLIAMDIFLDDTVPAEFEEPEFLKALKNRLATGGLLIYNRLALTDRDRSHTTSFYEKVFKKIFPEGTYLDVGGNWMLMNRGIGA